jgi:hypothetical protein
MTDKADPSLEKLLRDRAEPKATQSKTDSDAPILVIPNSDKVDPKRAKDRKDMEEPKWPKSSTDSALPTREKLRTDNDDPMIAMSSTDKEKTDPSRAIPSNATEDPIRANDRIDRVAPR